MVIYGVNNPTAAIPRSEPTTAAELGATRVQISSVGSGAATGPAERQDAQRVRVLQEMVAEKTEQLRSLSDTLKSQQQEYKALSDRYEDAVAVAVDLLATAGLNSANAGSADPEQDINALRAELDMAQMVQDSLAADVERLREELARANLELEDAVRQSEQQVTDRLRDGMILEAEAANALMAIGAPAVPELVRALENVNPLVRRWAANILAGMGPEAQQAVPALTEAMSDEDAGVRAAARAAMDAIAG
jgi:HEAT repeat protein